MTRDGWLWTYWSLVARFEGTASVLPTCRFLFYFRVFKNPSFIKKNSGTFCLFLSQNFFPKTRRVHVDVYLVLPYMRLCWDSLFLIIFIFYFLRTEFDSFELSSSVGFLLFMLPHTQFCPQLLSYLQTNTLSRVHSKPLYHIYNIHHFFTLLSSAVSTP